MPQRENERLLTGIFTLVEHSDLVITGALQRKKESCCNGDDCRSTMTNDNRGLHASCRACDVRREREKRAAQKQSATPVPSPISLSNAILIFPFFPNFALVTILRRAIGFSPSLYLRGKFLRGIAKIIRERRERGSFSLLSIALFGKFGALETLKGRGRRRERCNLVRLCDDVPVENLPIPGRDG